MARKQGGIQNAVSRWAYQNRRGGTRAADVLKSLEETEKTLGAVKVKKK